jgi:kanamycin kinase
MERLPGSPEAPKVLKTEYADWRWEVAWQYGPPALTYRLSHDSEGVRFLKLAPALWYPRLEDEANRMRWAVDYLPVPIVTQQGSDGQISWLVTRAFPGRDGTHSHWATDPERLVRILAKALRAFHEAPVRACPFDFRLEPALAHARRRLEEGRIQPDQDFHPEFDHLSAEEAIALLERTRPSSERLVVCHGDYCLPNVLIGAGAASGFVDLGELGVADRWWDLAVATWSVTWNLGPGLEDLFLQEYGVDWDRDRVDFYRLLYDVVS